MIPALGGWGPRFLDHVEPGLVTDPGIERRQYENRQCAHLELRGGGHLAEEWGGIAAGLEKTPEILQPKV